MIEYFKFWGTVCYRLLFTDYYKMKTPFTKHQSKEMELVCKRFSELAKYSGVTLEEAAKTLTQGK